MSLICIPMQMTLIKALGEKGSRPFSFERLATFPPQADHVLVVFFLVRGGTRGAALKPPTVYFCLSSCVHVVILLLLLFYLYMEKLLRLQKN